MTERCFLFIAGLTIVILASLTLPSQASAFWPFSTQADAAANAFVPNASTPVLVANISSDNYTGTPMVFATSANSALIPNNGPSGTIFDIKNTPPPGRISVYSVRVGDTLSEIADMFDVSVNTIIWANNLRSIGDIRVGDTLVILPVSGIEHTIIKGDTLKSIAKKYSADADEIAQFNGLDPENSLEVGSIIIIPGGEIVPVTPTPKIKKNSSSRIAHEPYLGGSGPILPGYYSNPLPGSAITQALHGWNGVDLGAARGTSIRTAADGTVIVARNSGWNGGYGNYVVIMHNNGTQTLYSHMTRSNVSAGQSVSAEQIIGSVGSTGLSTGPHLHFEVRGAANPFRNCPTGAVCNPQ